MKWIEWGVLALGTLWALFTNFSVREHYKASHQPAIPANSIALFQTLAVLGVWLLHFSSLHLVWLIPSSYVYGFIALRVRPLSFLAWLYGYLVAYTSPANW